MTKILLYFCAAMMWSQPAAYAEGDDRFSSKSILIVSYHGYEKLEGKQKLMNGVAALFLPLCYLKGATCPGYVPIRYVPKTSCKGNLNLKNARV